MVRNYFKNGFSDNRSMKKANFISPFRDYWGKILVKRLKTKSNHSCMHGTAKQLLLTNRVNFNIKKLNSCVSWLDRKELGRLLLKKSQHSTCFFARVASRGGGGNRMGRNKY